MREPVGEKGRGRERQRERVSKRVREQESKRAREREHSGRFIVGLLLSCFHRTLCVVFCPDLDAV